MSSVDLVVKNNTQKNVSLKEIEAVSDRCVQSDFDDDRLRKEKEDKMK